MPPDNINGVNTGFWLGFPFDQEIFIRMWEQTPDMVTHALLNSGAMVDDALITEQLANGGNLFTMPFVDNLDGEPDNYDGTNDIPVTEMQGRTQSGMCWGRLKGWGRKNFINDLSGNDPMQNMAARIAKYWGDYRQRTLVGILQALFAERTGTTNQYTADFVSNHTLARSSRVGVTDFNELGQQALGDNRTALSLIIAHSRVVSRLESLNLVDFKRYTDQYAVPGSWRVGYVGGHVLVESDQVPVDGTEYTTFMLGSGVIRNARGRLEQPQVEVNRDPKAGGGRDEMLTRIREVIHPNGFTFRLPAGAETPSPELTDLTNPEYWTCIFDPKAIPITRLITDEGAA